MCKFPLHYVPLNAKVCSRDPDKLHTASNVSYNIVRRSAGRGGDVESEYEAPDQSLPPPTSFQRAAAVTPNEDPLYEQL